MGCGQLLGGGLGWVQIVVSSRYQVGVGTARGLADPDRLRLTRTLRAARRSTTAHPGWACGRGLVAITRDGYVYVAPQGGIGVPAFGAVARAGWIE